MDDGGDEGSVGPYWRYKVEELDGYHLIGCLIRRALGNIARNILSADKDESVLLSGNGCIAAEEPSRGALALRPLLGRCVSLSRSSAERCRPISSLH